LLIGTIIIIIIIIIIDDHHQSSIIIIDYHRLSGGFLCAVVSTIDIDRCDIRANHAWNGGALFLER
jgi:hypothetical protein